jgi:hypothetical protein
MLFKSLIPLRFLGWIWEQLQDSSDFCSHLTDTAALESLVMVFLRLLRNSWDELG